MLISILKRAAFAALAVSLALGPGRTAALAAGTPQQIIDGLDQTLLTVMRNADKLGYDGRYKLLEPAINRTFNVPLMTHIVAGSFWNEWSPEQRDVVVQAFGKFIVSTYARRFDGYSGEQFIIDGNKPAPGGNGTVVMTRITRPNDSPVQIHYLIRDNGQSEEQVVDVFLTGTISELATRRSEFGAVLQRDGYQGLLTVLAAKSTAQATP